MTEKIYVVAEKLEQALEFGRSKGVPFSKIRYIDYDYKLKGLRDIKLHVLKTAPKLLDYHEIMIVAQARDLRVEYEA